MRRWRREPRQRFVSRRSRLAAIRVAAVAAALSCLSSGALFAGVGVSAETTTYRDEVLADGPVTYWRLGELAGATATDQTGANSGTYTGGVTLGVPGALPGDSDRAASFDGVNDYVVAASTASLSMTRAVSIELWAKRAKAGRQVLLGKPGTRQFKLDNYALWINTADRPQAYFGNGSAFATVSGPVLDTAWHHIVATYDGAVARIYLDGAPAASSATALTMKANTSPLNLARANNGKDDFGGSIDEVAVYPAALDAARIRAHYDRALVDLAPPSISLAQPANGSTTGDSTPAFSGLAGTAPGDSSTVTVAVYAGASASGTPVQTLTTTRSADGSFSVDAAALAEGTYTGQAEQTDAAGNIGRSGANTFTVGAAGDPVLIGAGDIASCESGDGDASTAALLAAEPDATVFTLGDNAYPNGQPSEYSGCYGPTWGAAKARTRPTIGGHDLATVSGGPAAGQGYVDYFSAQLSPFGPTATDLRKLYYSYDIGTWHVVMLNAGCYFETPGCDPTAMEQWFRDDLAAHPSACTVAMWHDARFSSGNVHGDTTFVQPLWSIAYAGGVDLVLGGHEHDYERFAPQDAGGALDRQFGVREIVVGTGGYYLYGLGTRQANSEAYSASTYGVLRLTLHPGSYDWEFRPVAGGSFRDSGTDACHGPPTQPTGGPQVRSSASATAGAGVADLAIARPSGSQPGDVLLAVAAHQGGSTRNMTPPSGWTAIQGADVYEGGNARIHAWYHVASSSEPASYTFTTTGGTPWSSAGGIMAISGADPLAPIAAAGGASTGSTNTINLTAPSITTTMPDTLLVYGGAVNQPALFTPPQLMTERWDLSTAATYNVATEAAVRGFATAGATGPATAFLNVAARGVAIQIAMAPAP